jgi:16S rRNA processing protein RimM
MQVLTDFPERLHPGQSVYLGADRQGVKIKSVRWHGKNMLIGLHGYNSREAVGDFRNQFVAVLAEDLPPLPEGEFYHHQVLGLRVIDEDGRAFGHIAEILETGANDVYVVRGGQGRDLLLPVIDSVILQMDLEKGEIIVRLLPGLLAE